MEALSLEDVLPAKPEFTLASTGKTYSLRLVNLDDQVWLKQKFGSDANITKIFETQDWGSISQLAYRLLTDKSDFRPQEVDEEDDEGNVARKKLSGVEVFRRSVTGLEEGIAIVKAILASITNSSPKMRGFVDSEVKKNLKALQTSQPSSTSSHPSTESASTNLGA